MPHPLSQARTALKALRQLGPGQVGLYTFYRLGLESGWLEYKTRLDITHALRNAPDAFTLHPLFNFPNLQDVRALLGEQGVATLLAEADEIAAGGSVRLFGGEPFRLDLAHGSSNLPWTAYARGRIRYPVQDVKFLWEPARFGWVFTLGRAYLLSGDERYPAGFWQHARQFLVSNPPNLGPHWVSAQEVALRILAFTWAAQAFAASHHSTPEWLAVLGSAVASYAARIPATLFYSRAQNNNHLLSEAVGLLTSGLALPNHPQAQFWKGLGWKWLLRGLMNQISTDGTYVQHSTSYHRLMLHLALWVHAITQPESFSGPVHERLAAATSWLLALLDHPSGRVPNLGPNDGANILSLSICAYSDYRPVLQAASWAFLGEPCLPPGTWDEISMWLGLSAVERSEHEHSQRDETGSGFAPTVLHNKASTSWAYLRAAHLTSRPGHADQLHLDLWWRGLNVAQDAGSYLYNAPSPWDNSLAHTAVHNTLSVDDREQMQRAGRFLYLDWAQAQVLRSEHAQDGSRMSLVARHDGYQQLGLIHQRSVTSLLNGGWQIDDHLEPAGQPTGRFYRIRLHWLVPDWPWQVAELPEGDIHIDLESPNGVIHLHMRAAGSLPGRHTVGLQVVRAGEVLHGHQATLPTWGWASPTYGVKLPALSLSLNVEAALPLTLTSRWILPSAPHPVMEE